VLDLAGGDLMEFTIMHPDPRAQQMVNDDCDKKLKLPPNWPLKPGYYWARLTAPHEGSFEAEEWNPSVAAWEIVKVNDNVLGWENDPAADESLSVSVPGIRETQWRDCFQWGEFVADLRSAK
jgi:hypothetical protein